MRDMRRAGARRLIAQALLSFNHEKVVITTPTGNGAMKRTATPTAAPRLWWFLLPRGLELELRRRKAPGQWRFICPVDGSHEATMANGRPGLALTCHGPAGDDGPGHSLSVHRLARQDIETFVETAMFLRYLDLDNIPWPCQWCGCTESQVLASLGARPRDKYQQDESEPCSEPACRRDGYSIGSLPVLCLWHLVERAGLDPEILFEPGRGVIG